MNTLNNNSDLGSATQIHNAAPTTGNFKEYDSQLPVPELKGYRIVKCLYKENSKTGKKAGNNSYIHIVDAISQDAVKENLTQLMPHIVSFLQGVEDEIVKGKHKTGTVFLDPSALGMPAVIEKLEEKTARLDKEAVEKWFNDSVLSALQSALVTKLGISEEPTAEELQKIQNVTDTYKTRYVSLSSGRTTLSKEDATTLQKALEVTKATETHIGEKFYMRLESMKTKSTELLMSL